MKKFTQSQMSQELGGKVAKLETTDAPLPFIQVGQAADAVILRLKSKLPRVRVKKVASPHQRGWGTDGDSPLGPGGDGH